MVEGLIESGEIKVWKAQEIAKNLARQIVRPETSERESACGKIIMLGEHAVVYGRPAIALPIPLAVEAAVRKTQQYWQWHQCGDSALGLEQKVSASTRVSLALWPISLSNWAWTMNT